jgi:dissimilatory sulfite reductase (desulfoviridin) alpha/beta subunit
MYYCVYKITNNINGKYYIGAHKTYDLNDSYMGSGIGIIRAIRKYGAENFTKEIIEIFEDKNSMYNKEKELVQVCNMSYNMTSGGRGSWDHIDSKGDNNPMRRSEATRKKVSESLKKTRAENPKLNEISKQNLKKAVESNTGKKRPKHSDFMKIQMKIQWEVNKEKMRNALSSYYEIINPQGEKIVTNRLKDYCATHSLSYTTMYETAKTNKPPKKGKNLGWYCRKIERK